MRRMPTAVVILLTGSALAQDSASYVLDEHAFNGGGRPAQGVVGASASYRISLESIGEGFVAPALAALSYRLDGALVAGFPPPGEVSDLRFSDSHTLTWQHETSARSYGIYRDLLPRFAPDYGACLGTVVGATTTDDTDLPAADQAFFYLVTARNRLSEEGTKGFASSGAQRANSVPCP